MQCHDVPNLADKSFKFGNSLTPLLLMSITKGLYFTSYFLVLIIQENPYKNTLKLETNAILW